MPQLFWPWAITHWHSVYNYWVKASGRTGWEGLTAHRSSQDFECDLQLFGCYVRGHLSREHPLVGEDTTHVDRGLEGVFLGCQWDLTTPTFWLWSFKLRKPVRLEGPCFKPNLYPFRDQGVLVDSHAFTVSDVAALHNEDGPLDQLFTDGDSGEPSSASGEPPASGVLKRLCESLSAASHSGEQPPPAPAPSLAQSDPLTAEGERQRSV
eukprot:3241589-Rhodomonas_salina.1